MLLHRRRRCFSFGVPSVGYSCVIMPRLFYYVYYAGAYYYVNWIEDLYENIF